MDFKRDHDEIILQMRHHIEKKNCCRSHEEYLDENPVEPGIAFTDGYYIYQSDCPEAKKLNLKMLNLLADQRKKRLINKNIDEILLNI